MAFSITHPRPFALPTAPGTITAPQGLSICGTNSSPRRLPRLSLSQPIACQISSSGHPSPVVLSDEKRNAILSKALPSVVRITAKLPRRGPFDDDVLKVSSSFMTPIDSLLMTAAHAVFVKRLCLDGAKVTQEKTLCSLGASLYDRGIPWSELETMVIDLAAVLAILCLNNPLLQIPPLEFTTKVPLIGSTCFGLGNPDIRFACSTGMVSNPCVEMIDLYSSLGQLGPSTSIYKEDLLPGYDVMDLNMDTECGFSGGPTLDSTGKCSGMILIGKSGCTIAVRSEFLLTFLKNASKMKPGESVWTTHIVILMQV